MILKRYGERMHSVGSNFDAPAMTEVSFMRLARMARSVASDTSRSRPKLERLPGAEISHRELAALERGRGL